MNIVSTLSDARSSHINIVFDGIDTVVKKSGLIEVVIKAVTHGVRPTELLKSFSDAAATLTIKVYGAVVPSLPLYQCGAASFSLNGDDAVAARFIIPQIVDSSYLSLINVGLLVLKPVVKECWDFRGSWLVLSLGEPELFADYFSTFNAGRIK